MYGINTKFYTYTADFAGYTLADFGLGTDSPEQYRDNCGDKSETECAKDLLQYCLESEGAWTRRDEAERADHNRVTSLESFTPLELHRYLISLAE